MITGQNFIGRERTANTGEPFRVFSPLLNKTLGEEFFNATSDDLEATLKLSQKAFRLYKNTGLESRALFLEEIAAQILELGEQLITRCSEETGLDITRIGNERTRTCMQLKMFAQLLREGWWQDARIEDPNLMGISKLDIRRTLVPIGPVAVFGASNFPLAFSTAGGDTASALAAGCPVVIKAHPSHAGTNELVMSAIIKAASRTGMPNGIISSLNLLHDNSLQLVKHPVIKAVGFTGSRYVGMKLFEAAMQRDEPIPVFAEMSSVNPVCLFDNALQNKAGEIAKGLVQSFTLGAGQFCTNPGIIILNENTASAQFVATLAGLLQEVKPQVMLNSGICENYWKAIQELKRNKGVSAIVDPGRTEISPLAAKAMVFKVNAIDFLANKTLALEIFGPSTLLVFCRGYTEMQEVIESLEGQLTISLHAEQKDFHDVQPVFEIAQEKAGRIIFNQFPTGVEVCHSMQHGGPFPATTDGRFTSVGTAAIYRFLRPVAFQNFPQQFLPSILRNENIQNIPRLVNGQWNNKSL